MLDPSNQSSPIDHEAKLRQYNSVALFLRDAGDLLLAVRRAKLAWEASGSSLATWEAFAESTLRDYRAHLSMRGIILVAEAWTSRMWSRAGAVARMGN